MSTVSCPAVIVPTRSPLWQRAWDDLSGGLLALVADVREQARRHARQRSLQGLSEETLRDIGLADSLPPRQPTVNVLDYERGRWS